MPSTDPKDSAIKGRLFVVDHMCVLPYGHNQGAVALFRQRLAADFAESHALIPRVLSAGAAKERGFTRCLNYPYNAFYYRRFESFFARWIKRKELRAGVQLWLRRAEKVALSGFARLFRFDPVLRRTESNWREQFRAYNIGGDDLILFPSVDYYGASACLDLLIGGEIKSPPRVHLRMICVMEHASLSSASACDLLLDRVRLAMSRGIRVSISGETSAYVSYLADKLGMHVTFFPYPLSGDAMPMPDSQPMMAASIGSGRGDKGYFLMQEIAEKTAARCGESIVFEIQAMPLQDHAFSAAYEASLAKVANVRMLPAVLEDDGMLDFFRRSYIAVLPYDPETYVQRGSAIFQEAVAFTRPVVCLAGAAFAGLIERYNNGYACHGVDEVVAAIADCAAVPTAEWDRRLAVARGLYEADVNEAIRQILAG